MHPSGNEVQDCMSGETECDCEILVNVLSCWITHTWKKKARRERRQHGEDNKGEWRGRERGTEDGKDRICEANYFRDSMVNVPEEGEEKPHSCIICKVRRIHGKLTLNTNLLKRTCWCASESFCSVNESISRNRNSVDCEVVLLSCLFMFMIQHLLDQLVCERRQAPSCSLFQCSSIMQMAILSAHSLELFPSHTDTHVRTYTASGAILLMQSTPKGLASIIKNGCQKNCSILFLSHLPYLSLLTQPTASSRHQTAHRPCSWNNSKGRYPCVIIVQIGTSLANYWQQVQRTVSTLCQKSFGNE